MRPTRLRVIILKPSKYRLDGYVERFRWGFMPNSTVAYMRSMTPRSVEGCEVETYTVDEYVQTSLDYLDLLRATSFPTVLALVGVQSHQFHRALDLAAFARANGVEHCVIGGPHPMTCDTRIVQRLGVSFALAEAELVWLPILADAIRGELAPVYGESQRWQTELAAPVLTPPARRDLRRYVVPMLGVYPARGCPYTCNFCSVIKIAGRQIRSQSLDTTLASLRAAKAGGVRMVMFTSDNFNKYPDAEGLLRAMIEERVRLPFFVQCDAQVVKQEAFVELLARAGCFQMFVGVESFNRKALLAAHKAQNHPERYEEIVRLCRKYGILSHFSNILGFPTDTEPQILDHLRVLRGMAPELASFYILTPVPGAEQYDEFMREGWITEENLDRFDGTLPTWRHPSLNPRQWTDLLFRCYREFYGARHLSRVGLQALSRGDRSASLYAALGAPAFMRFSAAMGSHPMSGGVMRVARDHVSSYRDFRMSRFGLERVPLPESLALGASDMALNAGVALAAT